MRGIVLKDAGPRHKTLRTSASDCMALARQPTRAGMKAAEITPKSVPTAVLVCGRTIAWSEIALPRSASCPELTTLLVPNSGQHCRGQHKQHFAVANC
jgi:hypothetical protein